MTKPKIQEKVFILDTNVLVYDPEALFKFPRHPVIIPVTVIEELDKLKRSPGDLGKNARTTIRLLDEMRYGEKGNLHTGIKLENKTTISIHILSQKEEPRFIDLSINDNKIIMSAYELKEQGRRAVFVSKDFAARIKAEAIGLEAQDYENLKVSYEGVVQPPEKIEVDKTYIDTLFKNGSVRIPGIETHPNQYVVLSDNQGSFLNARFSAKENCFVKLIPSNDMWGIRPKNQEQLFATDALLRRDVQLVCLIGQAGTGKTLLALAAGMRQVFDEKAYRKILISRPIVPLGRDIGYLPGTKEEKLSHWMQPIFDNLELICSTQENASENIFTWVMENKRIEMEAVTYIRGRSLPRMYIIIDEAQNLTPHEIKTIISRAGEGTKVVLAGDPTQIDNPYLDKNSNGLTYAFSKFRNQPIAASIFLEKTERSELAKLAAELL
jgi:PhoH-like ATPase